MVVDLKYFNSLENKIKSLQSQLVTQRTQFLNEIDRLSREYYYVDHMNAILGVYTTLDDIIDLQCDYVDQVVKCERLEKELSKIKNDKAFKENQSKVFRKEREQYFEIQDLKAQLQDKNIALCELKKLNEKLKGKSVETKFEKPSVIRQPNAFKSQRQSVLGLKCPMVVPISTSEPKLTVNQSAVTPLKRTVAAESTNQKPRSVIRKQYEQFRIKSRTTTILEPTTLRKSIISNTPPSSNSFAARRDNSIHHRLWFGNDQIAPILGYGDLVQGNVTIKRVYYVEGLNHNLFSIGQFHDSDLEVAFWKSTCYIRDLKGNDLHTDVLEHRSVSILFKTHPNPNLI
ncbi:hypothetical protein Tco_0500418 [Tanacetum coccineum]